MSSRVFCPPEPAKGWQPWGALVPFLGIAFVAATVVSLTAVLQHTGLVDNKENPIGLAGFVAFLVFPFTALGVVVLGWVRFVERRPLASVGLRDAHRTRTFLYGQLVGIAMVTVISGNLGYGRLSHGRLGKRYPLSGRPWKYRHPVGLFRLTIQYGGTSLPRLDAFRYRRQVRPGGRSRAFVAGVQPYALRFPCELDLRDERVSFCRICLLLGDPYWQCLGRDGLARRMELAAGCRVLAARHSIGRPPAGTTGEA